MLKKKIHVAEHGRDKRQPLLRSPRCVLWTGMHITLRDKWKLFTRPTIMRSCCFCCCCCCRVRAATSRTKNERTERGLYSFDGTPRYGTSVRPRIANIKVADCRCGCYRIESSFRRSRSSAAFECSILKNV